MVKTKEKAPEPVSETFTIGGAWGNMSASGKKYLVAPVAPEMVSSLIDELKKYKDTGCRIVSFEFTNCTDPNKSYPAYTHTITPNRKKD